MDLLYRLLETSETVVSVAVDGTGRVHDVNPALSGLLGRPGEKVVGSALPTLLPESELATVESWIGGGALPEERVRLNFLTASGAPVTLECLVRVEGDGFRIVGEPDARGDRGVVEELMRLNNELATMARERARRERELERTRQSLQATLEELETSYWHLKKIQEVLPLCMRCGRVKNAEAEWQSVAEYLKANEIFLSHGYCPPCTDAVMGEFGLEEESR